MKIFLLMIPPTVTAQERKVKIVRGRPFFYKPENVKVAQAEIIRHLRPFKPQAPMEGAKSRGGFRKVSRIRRTSGG